MQGLITLDFGNSNPHAGLFRKDQNNWKLLKVVPLNELALYQHQLEMSPHNTSVVVCEVKSREDEITKLQEQGYLITRLKDYWRGQKFAGMSVHYASTLGEDRLIEAYYVYKLDKRPTLIIDAGTFVTMDIVTEQGFLGGFIIPGLKNYFEIYQAGEQLKSVPLKMNFQQDLPTTTDQAISGSYLAFAALAKDLIQKHQIQKIILTGGNASTWENYLKEMDQSLVVETSPHLIHLALQYWMKTQIEPL